VVSGWLIPTLGECGKRLSDVRRVRGRHFGVTPRKTVDTAVASRRVASGHEPPHHDRNFDPFARRIGIRAAV
jgi:hypothetical protein